MRLAQGPVTACRGRSCPKGMEEMLADETSPGAERAMAAVMRMKKIDIAAIERAHAGG